ncbi:hypothetical protein M569_14229, partial [Genlisea aurea]
GFAFDPVDGTIHAVPQVLAPFIVPMHFRTHMVLMFLEGVWAAYIHEGVANGSPWPAMGPGYHTIHHSTFRHNYGNYTVFMDWIFGTLRHP